MRASDKGILETKSGKIAQDISHFLATHIPLAENDDIKPIIEKTSVARREQRPRENYTYIISKRA